MEETKHTPGPWTKDMILGRINRIKEDERLSYPVATVFANAPLALIQVQLLSELNALENVIGMPLSNIPLKKKSRGK